MLNTHLPRGSATTTCSPSLSPRALPRISCRARASGAATGSPYSTAHAFAKGTHARLGSVASTAKSTVGGNRRSRHLEGKAPAAAADTSMNCAYVTMPGELVQQVVEACTS